MGTGSFSGVKRPGRGVDHPSPFSAEVKERVALYLYTSSGPSWPVLGWILSYLTVAGSIFFVTRIAFTMYHVSVLELATFHWSVPRTYGVPCISYYNLPQVYWSVTRALDESICQLLYACANLVGIDCRTRNQCCTQSHFIFHKSQSYSLEFGFIFIATPWNRIHKCWLPSSVKIPCPFWSRMIFLLFTRDLHVYPVCVHVYVYVYTHTRTHKG